MISGRRPTRRPTWPCTDTSRDRWRRPHPFVGGDRAGRRPVDRSRRSGRPTPTISTVPSRSPAALREDEVDGALRGGDRGGHHRDAEARSGSTRPRCRPSSSPRTARSRGARCGRRRRQRDRPGGRGGDGEQDAGPRSRRPADVAVPARAPLPPQARRERLLRSAPRHDRRRRRRKSPVSTPPVDSGWRASSSQQPGPGEVLVRVTAVGLCGSDLHWYREGGHRRRDASRSRSSSGTSSSGSSSRVRGAGERVVADPADPCGRCEACLGGRAERLCLAARFAGFGTTDGALRTVMPWPKRLLHRLPDAMGDDEATLLEPLGVALHALDLGPVGGRRSGRRLRLRAARAAARPAAADRRRLRHRGDRSPGRIASRWPG